MISMRVMQMTVNEVIGVIAVRDCLMAASWPMNMASFMPAAIMSARAPVRVLARNLDPVLLDLIATHVVKMTIVEVVNVTLMAHRSMAATRAVTVWMVLMFLRGSHCFSCSSFGKTEAPLAIKLDARLLFL
jgi:hypothetical protein